MTAWLLFLLPEFARYAWAALMFALLAAFVAAALLASDPVATGGVGL